MRVKLNKKYVIHEYYYIWYYNKYNHGFLRNWQYDHFLLSSIFWKKHILYDGHLEKYIYHICG